MQKKKRIGAIDYVVWGGMFLFILSCLLCSFESRFTPVVLVVWGVLFVMLLICVGIDMQKLHKQRYCPKCGERLQLPFFPKRNQTVEVKCRNCGHTEDTGVTLPEVTISD